MHRPCRVEGCPTPSRSSGSDLCPKHYHRQYRHGSVHRTALAVDAPSTGYVRRYRTAYRPRHPLASKHGIVYVHRLALYEEIGAGPHACHWCGTEVDWLPKCDPRRLVVDHLNSIGDDNRTENLVASCSRCNTARGVQARRRVLVAAGWWSKHDTVAALRKGGRVAPVDPNAAEHAAA